MNDPAASETLRQQGYEPLDADPDEFRAFIQGEIARWSGAVRTAGLRS